MPVADALRAVEDEAHAGDGEQRRTDGEHGGVLRERPDERAGTRRRNTTADDAVNAAPSASAVHPARQTPSAIAAADGLSDPHGAGGIQSERAP